MMIKMIVMMTVSLFLLLSFSCKAVSSQGVERRPSSFWSFIGSFNAESLPPRPRPRPRPRPTRAAASSSSSSYYDDRAGRRHHEETMHPENKIVVSRTDGNGVGVADEKRQRLLLLQRQEHQQQQQQQPHYQPQRRELPRTDDEYRTKIDSIASESPYDCSRFVDWGDVPIDCRPTDDPNGGSGSGGAASDVAVVVGVDDDDAVVFGDGVGDDDPVADNDEDGDNDISPISFSPAASPHNNVSPATAWQDDDDGGGGGGGSVNSPVASPSAFISADDESDDVPPPTIRNAVRLAASMGVVHLDELSVDDSHALVEMCLRAMTITLNSYDYKDAQDSGSSSSSSSSNNTNNTDRGSLSGPFFVSDRGLDLTIKYQEKESRYNDTKPIDDNSNTTTTSDDNATASTTINNDTQPPVVARLYLHEVHVRESDNVEDWFIVYATYAVTWPDRRPILSRSVLKEIHEQCHLILDQSMMAGRQFLRRRRRRRELHGGPDELWNIEHGSNDFWNTLTSLPFGQDLLLGPPPWPYDAAGLADCVDVGAEYDISQFMEPPRWDDAHGIMPPPPTSDAKNETYTTVLNTTWQAREWTGLAIMLGTLVVSSILSFTADRLWRQREREEAWGAILTEEGVGEILQVGWRYQQGGPPPQADEPRPGGGAGGISDEEAETEALEQQQQLFLQLYDKAKLGYNDDNSLLLGGVERQHFLENGGLLNRPPTTNTTETATTMTPPPATAVRNVPKS